MDEWRAPASLVKYGFLAHAFPAFASSSLLSTIHYYYWHHPLAPSLPLNHNRIYDIGECLVTLLPFIFSLSIISDEAVCNYHWSVALSRYIYCFLRVLVQFSALKICSSDLDTDLPLPSIVRNSFIMSEGENKPPQPAVVSTSATCTPSLLTTTARGA